MLAADNETWLIQPAQVAPPLVCVSLSVDGVDAEIIDAKDPACKRTVFEIIESDEQVVGANLPFDLGVWCNEWPELLEPTFDKLERGEFKCVETRQKLIDIAKGQYRGYVDGSTGKWVEFKYNLASLAKRHEFPRDLIKDTWRLKYGTIAHLPIAQWPQEAIDYSLDDSRSTWWVWNRQTEDERIIEPNELAQMCAHWALYLIAAWGIRTDPEMVEKLMWLTNMQLQDYEQMLFNHDPPLLGWKKEKGERKVKKNVKVMQQVVGKLWEASGLEPVKTDPSPTHPDGQYSLSEDAADRLRHPTLYAFQRYSSASTILDRVRELEAGTVDPIHTRFENLLVSGRTSSSNPNVQNRSTTIMARPRCDHELKEGKLNCPECGLLYHIAGDRESIVARDGCVILVCDVPGLELRTIGETAIQIVGYSRLADFLNEGKDPHLEVAAVLLGITAEEAYQRKKLIHEDFELYLGRQTGKIVTFGLNARLGVQGMIEQARTKYGITMTEDQAELATEAYYATYPEQLEFHAWVDSTCRNGDNDVEHLFSGRIQGMLSPTQKSNTYSQGLGADACKSALYALVRECYIGKTVLYNSRVINFAHDEFLTETEEERLDEKAEIIGQTICDRVNEFIPHVPVPLEEMKPYPVRRWSKLSKKIVNPDGSLGVWDWPEWHQQRTEHG